MGNPFGRASIVPLTNKSGGSVAAGDVVIVDTANNDSFTTTTTGAFTGGLGIAQATIASNAVGLVLVAGYASLVNVNASVTRGNYGKTHTVAKQATDAGASRIAGTFCQFLTGGTTPDAVIWQPDLGGGSGLADPMTTRGDVIVRNSSNVTARLAAGVSLAALRSDGTDVAYAILPGTLIGAICYGNSTDTKTTVSTSMVDADATNLAVTFTAPASGNVLVRLTAVGSGDAGGAAGGQVGDFYSWGLRESSSDIAGPAIVTRLPVAGSTANLYASHSIVFKITGLTPGSAHTYKWSHKVSNARCTGTIVTQDAGPATMEVIAL